MEIKPTLKQARLLAGMTIEEARKIISVSKSTYMDYENNPDKVTVAQAKKLAEAFNIPYNEIFFNN